MAAVSARQIDALPLQLAANATAQHAQRIGRVGQEDCEAAWSSIGGGCSGLSIVFLNSSSAVDRLAELAHLRRESPH